MEIIKGVIPCAKKVTFGVNGTGEKGDVTVTAAQQEVAAYVFTDTTKTGA